MRVGIFADVFTACTGFSIVCRHLAQELAGHDDLEVYYFGRFGCEKGSEEPRLAYNFMYVPCEGGVWDGEFVIQLIRKYELDLIFSEDDWFSAEGLVRACGFWNKPFYFLTPIDSTPVHVNGLILLKKCNRVFVPTRGAQTYLKGQNIESVWLPHGCDYQYFRPFKVTNKPEGFTFLWIGRDGKRKALGRTILAYQKLLEHGYKANLIIRTDWTVPQAQRTLRYIQHKHLPITTEQMEDCPHEELAKTYNRADVFICSSKAGGFELGIIEANACSLPVICTDHTFMNEQVVNGKSGLLVPVEKFTLSEYNSIWGGISVDGLYQKMKYYVEHPDIAKIHGRWGKAWVRRTFRWDKTGEILYEKIGKN